MLELLLYHELPITIWGYIIARVLSNQSTMVDGHVQKGLSSKLDKKRKREAHESTKLDKPETATAAPAAADGSSKKRKKAKKHKKQSDQGETQDRKDGIDESIGRMDGRLLADHFAQRAKKLDKELSAVELSDLSVPGMF